MSSNILPIGFEELDERTTNSYIGFERFETENSRLPLLFSYLSAVYTEIVDYWCQIKWLKLYDNHQETFLILNPDITGYLTVQIAINENCFQCPRFSLLNQPECLLIRTEYNTKSLLIPNLIISLEYLLNRTRKSVYGKLIAIISNENNSKFMFYKALSNNCWHMLHNNQSRILTNEEYRQIEAILQQENQLQLSQLPFPLSMIFKHPIIFVYIIQEIK